MASPKLTMRQRVLAVLRGETPDRLPFIDRLELWHKGLLHTGGLPAPFVGVPLGEIHRRVGIGQQKFIHCYGIRLRGVEVVATFEGEEFYRQHEPVLMRFPDADELAPAGKVGVTTTEYRTAVGTLTVQHKVIESVLAAGARPYMSLHAIREDADYAVAEYILERAEFVPRFAEFKTQDAALGDFGFALPFTDRIPFQQALIDYISTDTFFYALSDAPQRVERLMDILDARLTEAIGQLAALDVPYIEIPDNLDGVMTHPRLFRKYALPQYQKYTDLLHRQGKKVGAHTDGNLRPLLALFAESGLDVCESVAPSPLTPAPFDEIWAAWRAYGPIIWGGIPTPLLEARTPEPEFRAYVRHLLDTVGRGPIILGVSDMVLPNNLIERVQAVAEMVEAHAL